MSHNDKPPSGYPPFRQLIPVPDVDDDEIDAAAGLLQEFFSAVDFSFEEDVLTYYSPPASPRGEPERPEVVEVPHREQVQVMAEDRGDQPQDFIQEDFDENELIYALDALEEDEGEQRPVHVQLLDDDDTEILDLGLLQINPTPSHSRDPVAPQLESEGEVLVPSSPLQSEYGSPPHLSPYYRNDPVPPSPLPLPGPSRLQVFSEETLQQGPMEIVEPRELEVTLETGLMKQQTEPLPSTSRGSRGIWSTGLALGVDGSGKMTGLNLDFTSGVAEPGEYPRKGSSRKRNISSASSSSQNRSRNVSSSRKADLSDILARSRARQRQQDAKKMKRESRSTSKKRTCNSKALVKQLPDPGDDLKEANIDNPIRPTYPGAAGKFVKKFPSIPGVMEWFAKQKTELELEMNVEELDLEFQTWESTRSKCKARRAASVPAGDIRADLEEPMDFSDDFSDVEEEDEEEEKEKKLPYRRGSGWPRKMN